ncbi:MAG: energy transducer TonB [Methyloprofundus sp.]|nr:energy transducer TonB [Methyloprofundus sp.]MDT8426243.1 energy transducer TonB [Methyloprofundus sp.]
MDAAINRGQRQLFATGSMLFGSFLAFGLIVVMNNWQSGPEQDKTPSSTQVDVVKQVKPKPKKELEKPKPKPKPKKMRAPVPFKGLNTALSGIDLGLPGLMGEDLNAVNGGLLGGTQAAVMTDDLVDVAPKPKSRSAFKYPASAKKKGITGYVLLSLLIDTQGNVEQVEVLESSPPGVFDDVVTNAIRSWQFEPALYQGKSVKVWAKQKIRFDLS